MDSAVPIRSPCSCSDSLLTIQRGTAFCLLRHVLLNRKPCMVYKELRSSTTNTVQLCHHHEIKAIVYNATLENSTSRSFLSQQGTSLLRRDREMFWLPVLTPHFSGTFGTLLDHSESYLCKGDNNNNTYFIGLL